VNAGNLPAPVLDAQGNVNTLYMIYFPAGKNILLGTVPSCQNHGFCANHNSTNALFGGKNLLYGVMPDTQPPSAGQAEFHTRVQPRQRHLRAGQAQPW
jgi:hypothetical protein